ncbi:MAG: hypothetical protein LBC52_03515 [Treponema sp.]|jgi:hypothetical protein|nr:hypothetical protein [Treponema sp.]
MSPKTLKKLLFSLFFLYLPLLVYSQSNRSLSVALVPFWGPDDIIIKEFGEELYKGVNDQQGFRSVPIDMTNLPDDVPEGGYPPYICPSPSLIGTNPLALTGELTNDDPDDPEYWDLRLYLWEMNDKRLVFCDKISGYDREEIAMGMPETLKWLFHWLTRGGRGSGEDGEGDTSNLYGGKQIFITTSMPLQWIYIGARVGGSLRMQGLPSWEGAVNTYVESRYETINAALSVSSALFPEHIPFFSRFVVQGEGLFNYDFKPDPVMESLSPSTMTIIPAVLLKCQVIRHGNTLISLFGGAYTSFRIGDTMKTINYSHSFPIGWTAGLTYGGKVDPIPGIFFFDVRISGDLFDTYVIEPWQEGYRRTAVSVSIGYEYGLFTKK